MSTDGSAPEPPAAGADVTDGSVPDPPAAGASAADGAPDPQGARAGPAAGAAPGVRRYARDGVVVTYEVALCAHAGECVRGLPEVFDTARRPWIQPEHASVQRVVEVVGRCPTRALKTELTASAEG